MQDVDKIIQSLNRSGSVSGTQLGQDLSVSRVAVQKKIQALLDLGLPVTATPGVGYTLESGVSLLEADRIAQSIVPASASLIGAIDVMQSTESTNSYLLSKPIEVGRASVCVAEAQTAGRGRRGNDWQSAPYRNVMLSLSWGFDHWPATITGLSLAVGLVVCEYLNLQYNIGATIKWPNDLLVGDEKLGGILVDVSGESSGACHVVVGLGLNVHQPDWSTQEDYRWQDMSTLGVKVDRNVLIGELVSVLSAMLSEFAKHGFSPLIERWNSLSSYANKEIRILSSDEQVIGRMVGVDETGALLVDVSGELRRFDDSSVSVRLL